MMKELLITIKEMHKLGVYHLDLKLKNIIWNSDNNLRRIEIIDYGTSKKMNAGECDQLTGYSFECLP